MIYYKNIFFDFEETYRILGITEQCLKNLIYNVKIIKPFKQVQKIWFSFNQIIELKTIIELKEQSKVAYTELSRAKNFLTQLGVDKNLYNKHLIISGKDIYLVKHDNLNKLMIQITGKCKGQLGLNFFLVNFQEIVNKIDESAKIVNIENYRTKRRFGVKQLKELYEYDVA